MRKNVLRRTVAGLLLMCGVVAGLVWVTPLNSRASDLGDKTGFMWEVLEWSLTNTSPSQSNKFDVVAKVTFNHDGSSAQHVTEMFYDGGSTWRFRFTGTKTGTWTFTTQADGSNGTTNDPQLDGHSGTITVNPGSDDAHGFLVAAGQKHAWQVGNDGDLRPIPKFTYARNPETWYWGKDNTPTDDLSSYFAPALDEAVALGYDTWWINMRHAWFKWDAWSWNDHDNVNPDLTVFRMLENHIQDVHSRGLALDIRMWGDSGHAWSAEGLPGGINGYVDQRLQRYIAARLGALPGWSISYGYDLFEFLSPSQGEVFADYMNDHLGWPHLFWMRDENEDSYQSSSEPVVSVNDHPSDPDDIYNTAINRFNEASNNGRPVLFERNFDNGRWSDEVMRKGLWAFAMAGGAGGHYTDQTGPDIDTFGAFWNDHQRLLVDMEPNNGMSGDSNTWVLHSPSQDCLVAYRRDASSIQLDLSSLGGSQPAVAVDTKKDYSEVDLGTLSASNHTINLDYSSDWAIAVGDFGDSGPSPTDTPTPAPEDTATPTPGPTATPEPGLLASEPFDYATGSLGGNGGGTGWSGSWSGSNQVQSPGLTYSGLSVSGNRAAVDGSSASFRDLDQSYSSSSEIWISFLGQSDSVSPSIWNGIALFNGSTETLFMGVPYQSSSPVKWGLDVKTGSGTNLSGVNVDSNVTLCVVRIKNNTVTAWINPSLDGTPSDGSSFVNESVGSFSFDRVRLEGGSGDTVRYDELRIGNTFEDVTPTSTPGSTATPTPTPEDTATPTDTPVPPTATPEPGLLASEPFDYTTGSLGGNGGGTGWSGYWSGSNQVQSPGLTYSGLSTSGNRAAVDGSSASFRDLAQSYGADGSEIWISFLGQSDSVSPSIWNGIALFNGSTETLFVGVPYQSSSPVEWGLDLKNGTTVLSGVSVDSTVVLCVLRIKFNAGNDTVTAWINPSLGSTPGDGSSFVNESVGSFSFDRVRLEGGSGDTVRYDELRIGNTFEDVTP